MKKLPVDVSNFQIMIEDDYLYIDKTKIIYELITKRRLYFLSRPRRFGKSLLISTLKELFSGNKKLFENTWIGRQSDYTWPKHPVIHLDFSQLDNDTPESFKKSLAQNLEEIGKSYNIDVTKESLLNFKLIDMVKNLARHSRVVILIDNYDYPITANMTDQKKAIAIHNTIKNFLTVIKSLDGFGHIHAIFITGVTNISRASIFNGMNNVSDISLYEEASALVGFNHAELQLYFNDYIDQLAHNKDCSIQQVFDDLENWYNGYRFSKLDLKVYNPFSIIHCLHKNNIANYWQETELSQFLIDLLIKQNQNLKYIDKSIISREMLGQFDPDAAFLISVLYQTGYLTITDYDPTNKKYCLDFANRETRESFNLLAEWHLKNETKLTEHGELL